MSFSSTSNGRASSQHPSHFLSSLGPQEPCHWHHDHQDMQRPNFGDTRSDGPRRSVTLPNSDSLSVSHSWAPGFPDQNFYPSTSHLVVTPGGSQPPDPGVLGARYHLSERLLPHTSFTTGAPAVHLPAHAPPSTWIAHPTIPSPGPSALGGVQAVVHPWGDITAPQRQMIVAPSPVHAPAPPLLTSFPLPPVSNDPRALHPFPTAQDQDMFNADMAGWNRIAYGDNTSTHVPPSRPRRPAPPRVQLRQVPLVRIEDEVEWIQQHVLKVTLWLDLSPNADAEAHDPWD